MFDPKFNIVLTEDEEQDIVNRLTDSDSLLDVMVQLEDYLDSLDMYAFKNWIKGELVEGPFVKRYWVSFTLKYAYKEMPDPQGGLRLLKYGTKVEFEKSTEEVELEIKTPDDMDPATKKPKTTDEDIWLVNIRIPRRFIEELDTDDLELYDDELDTDDVTDARDSGIDEESGITDGDEGEIPDGEGVAGDEEMDLDL